MAKVSAATDGQRRIVELVEEVFTRIDSEGLDTISPYKGHPGRLAVPRLQEVVAAINRNRELKLVD